MLGAQPTSASATSRSPARRPADERSGHKRHQAVVTHIQASTGSAGLADGVVATLGEPRADLAATDRVREQPHGPGSATALGCCSAAKSSSVCAGARRRQDCPCFVRPEANDSDRALSRELDLGGTPARNRRRALLVTRSIRRSRASTGRLSRNVAKGSSGVTGARDGLVAKAIARLAPTPEAKQSSPCLSRAALRCVPKSDDDRPAHRLCRTDPGRAGQPRGDSRLSFSSRTFERQRSGVAVTRLAGPNPRTPRVLAVGRTRWHQPTSGLPRVDTTRSRSTLPIGGLATAYTARASWCTNTSPV